MIAENWDFQVFIPYAVTKFVYASQKSTSNYRVADIDECKQNGQGLGGVFCSFFIHQNLLRGSENWFNTNYRNSYDVGL